MDRNSIIRGLIGALGGAALALAFAEACAWVCVTASLGTFLTFLVWLLGFVLTLGLAWELGNVVQRTLTDDRINTACNKAKSLLGNLRSRIAS